MENEKKIDSAFTLSPNMGFGFLLLMLLFSLPGIWSAEKSIPFFPGIHDVMGLRILILMPWLMIAALGFGIWKQTSLGKIDRTVIPSLLLSLGVVVFISYDVLWTFAGRR